MKKTEEQVIIDKELGYIYIKENARARRLIFRCRDGFLHCTTPSYCSEDEIRRAIEKMRSQLFHLLQKNKNTKKDTLFSPHTTFEVEGTSFFSQQEDGTPCVTQNGNRIIFHYPADFDWNSTKNQMWLTAVLERILKQKAKYVLLPRLEELARQRELKFNKASVNSAKTRWGSCSSKRDIHLSLYLMVLPQHLRDFIMHHELTHLVEMNHGPHFHALLNHAVGGQEKALKKEIKQYQPSLIRQESSDV